MALVPFVALAPQAMAQTSPRMLVSGMLPGDRPDDMIVEITVLNPGTTPVPEASAEHLPAHMTVEGRKMPVTLERLSPVAAAKLIPPGGFVQLRYRLHLQAGEDRQAAAILSLNPSEASGFAFSIPENPRAVLAERGGSQAAPDNPPSPILDTGQPPAAKPDRGNAFLGNLSSYQPIYAVYGPGTNSDGRVQISFKYQLFGEAGAVGNGNPLINGIHFAYTQRMFWDLGAASSPFRNIDYMPEIFYLMPATSVGRSIALGAQAGFRHESNGRDGAASRSLNMLYFQPIATVPVGKYTLSVGPRLSVFVGDLSNNPDVRRYRGNTALFAEIGQDDGLRLTTNSRFNMSTGKGAVDAELSYPLDRIVKSSLNLYVFGQGFAGYGENLLDYNRKISRLRIGIAIVR
ncbi:hypothetical protein BH10PSE12_BH10PSE12_27980 [soil metagenome]